MKRRSFFAGVLAVVFAPLAGLQDIVLGKRSQTHTMRWIHRGEGRWDDPSCWEPHGVPNKSTDVVIRLPNPDDRLIITTRGLDDWIPICRNFVLKSGEGVVDFEEGEMIVMGNFVT
jgi:hypothetical protein